MTASNFDCKVCFERFSESGPLAPHTLSCGHSLCENCISNLIAKSTSTGLTSFECPLCRALESRPLASIPKNYDLAQASAATTPTPNPAPQSPSSLAIPGRDRDRRYSPPVARQHALIHAAGSQPSFSCSVCHASFDTKAAFERHLTESGHRKKPTSTSGEHATLVTSPAKGFTCSVCHAPFTEKESFERHLSESGHRKKPASPSTERLPTFPMTAPAPAATAGATSDEIILQSRQVEDAVQEIFSKANGLSSSQFSWLGAEVRAAFPDGARTLSGSMTSSSTAMRNVLTHIVDVIGQRVCANYSMAWPLFNKIQSIEHCLGSRGCDSFHTMRKLSNIGIHGNRDDDQPATVAPTPITIEDFRNLLMSFSSVLTSLKSVNWEERRDWNPRPPSPVASRPPLAHVIAAVPIAPVVCALMPQPVSTDPLPIPPAQVIPPPMSQPVSLNYPDLSALTSPAPYRFASELACLIEMGFPAERARTALEATQGDTNRASELLVTQP